MAREGNKSKKRSVMNPKVLFVVLLLVIFVLALFAKFYMGKADSIDVADQNGDSSIPAAGAEAESGSASDGPQAEQDVYASLDGALFVGDSRTEGLKIYAGIENADFYCGKSMDVWRVVSGEKVTLNGREMSIYEMLDQKRYRNIIVCLGINELGYRDVNDFVAQYEKLISSMKAAQPGVPIYISLIFPLSESKSQGDKNYNNNQVDWYNQNIRLMAERNQVRCIDPTPSVVNANGALEDSSTQDGVHMNRQYCRIMAEYIASQID